MTLTQYTSGIQHIGIPTENLEASKDFYTKLGFEIERKRIDLPGLAIKSVGTYKATVKLYETMTAEVHLAVKAQTVDGEVIESKPAEAPAEAKAE